MPENFLNFPIDIDLWIQETKKTSKGINTEKSTARYIIIKLPKSEAKETII